MDWEYWIIPPTMVKKPPSTLTSEDNLSFCIIKPIPMEPKMYPEDREVDASSVPGVLESFSSCSMFGYSDSEIVKADNLFQKVSFESMSGQVV